MIVPSFSPDTRHLGQQGQGVWGRWILKFRFTIRGRGEGDWIVKEP